MKPRLPRPRGPLSEMLGGCLTKPVGPTKRWVMPDEDPLAGEDTQLSLHMLYGLHYDGFQGVDDAWEWEPSTLELRSMLEATVVSALTDEASQRGAAPGRIGTPADVLPRVLQLLADSDGPSLSQFMADEGSVDQLREFVIHRSIYQRKEADPHTWAIPRLRGRAKSAMVTLQADEYGGGTPGQSHADLFADTMLALDLDPAPGAHIDQVPGTTLATDNLVSMFGLHRRWRGALVGHLAAFEMTSVAPMGRYASAVRRLLHDEAAARFYDVHVLADVRHAVIAADDLIEGLIESDVDAAMDVPFGVAALLHVESRFSAQMLQAWNQGRSSLRRASFTTSGTAEASFLDVLCLEADPSIFAGALTNN
jgi:Iron-containing redox enzyme